MRLQQLRHGAAGLIASVAAIAFVSPASAETMEPIPGNGFFLVGPDANKDHVVATNMSIGPMYTTINETVKAFESQNCQPWTRVN